MKFHSATPVTEQVVAAFEAELGVKLPGDYRLLLLQAGGGRPERDTFDIGGGRGRSTLQRFLGLGLKAPFGLEWARRTYRGRIPASCLPIALDDSGDVLLLRLTGDDAGAVLFWDHEIEEVGGVVAASVRELVRGLV